MPGLLIPAVVFMEAAQSYFSNDQKKHGAKDLRNHNTDLGSTVCGFLVHDTTPVADTKSFPFRPETKE